MYRVGHICEKQSLGSEGAACIQNSLQDRKTIMREVTAFRTTGIKQKK